LWGELESKSISLSVQGRKKRGTIIGLGKKTGHTRDYSLDLRMPQIASTSKPRWLGFAPSADAMKDRRAGAFAHAVVFDTLRATTTMIRALEQGCTAVYPCAEIEAAQGLADRLQSQGVKVLLAGERGGLPIPGFDLGNSPYEIPDLRGQSLVLTTTNGTRAMRAAQRYAQVWPGAIRNLGALAEVLCRHTIGNVLLLPAGEQGAASPEDELGCALLAGRLLQDPAFSADESLPANSYLDHPLVSRPESEKIQAWLASTAHGQELVRLGFALDLEMAGDLDATRVVGVLLEEKIIAWRITQPGWEKDVF
jgi:2-phosphosulfolactate phosphatase